MTYDDSAIDVTTAAIIFFLMGAVVALVIVRRVTSGTSYITPPAMAVSRKDDPHSFWMSLLAPAIIAAGLMLTGGFALWMGK